MIIPGQQNLQDQPSILQVILLNRVQQLLEAQALQGKEHLKALLRFTKVQYGRQDDQCVISVYWWLSMQLTNENTKTNARNAGNSRPMCGRRVKTWENASPHVVIGFGLCIWLAEFKNQSESVAWIQTRTILNLVFIALTFKTTPLHFLLDKLENGRVCSLNAYNSCRSSALFLAEIFFCHPEHKFAITFVPGLFLTWQNITEKS